MTLIRQEGDPAQRTPHIFHNHSGAKRWGNRLAGELTGLEVIEILQYCRSEASRVGYNDAFYERVGTSEIGPFHPELLGGYPAHEWACGYLEGIEDYANRPQDGELDEYEELEYPFP